MQITASKGNIKHLRSSKIEHNTRIVCMRRKTVWLKFYRSRKTNLEHVLKLYSYNLKLKFDEEPSAEIRI